MNAKTLAHSIQMGLKASTGLTVSRSHIHELVASAFGFSSHAALLANNVLCLTPADATFALELRKTDIARRALALGYQSGNVENISDGIVQQTGLAGIFPLPLEFLLDHLIEDEEHQPDTYFPIGDKGEYLDLTSVQVASALSDAAERGDARAHLALALLHSIRADDPHAYGGKYWFEQEQKGKTLVGAEKEWADSYRDICAADERAEKNLQFAADLGHPDALLLMAAWHGDTRFFDLTAPEVRFPAVFVAEAAELAQLPDQASRWLETAAIEGDIDVIERLVEMTSESAPLECWTWYELGKLHGTDLAEDNFRAVHEDGSDYDDDVGGPIELGGTEGLELPKVDESIKQLAKERAFELYQGSQNQVADFLE